MYTTILAIHNIFRWLVLLSLLFAIYRAYRGWLGNKPFTKLDNAARHITATILHVQLILGITLYCISPIVSYFLQHYKQAMHDREIRFFGMEHIAIMVLAIIVVTIGSAITKRKPTDQQKFRTMAIWYTLTLLLILSSVPWPFSPLVSRPYLRGF